ncbi:unnamed protein product [Caenorhabditis bovis]|uniref:Transmembrane protein 134 n=1 Tax=Caenorhabditis bovis TaxID=2654633 RepID=A0A8S1F8V7_9PELO|nr:unnamed protein product [Caenorhabditis bovis]
MPNIPGHQRNVSQGQHLIVDRTESDEEDASKSTKMPQETIQIEDDAPYGNGGVYPGSSPPYTPSRPQDNKSTGMCSPAIRANIRVILGSIFLTIIGSILIVLGLTVMIKQEEGMQFFVFLFAGAICFIPGFYHLYFVICTICGRPGYSFDKLPTFNR